MKFLMSPLAVQQSIRLEHLPPTYVPLEASKRKIPYVGINSVLYQKVIHWNILQKQFKNTDLTSSRGSNPLRRIRNRNLNKIKLKSKEIMAVFQKIL